MWWVGGLADAVDAIVESFVRVAEALSGCDAGFLGKGVWEA